MATYQGSLEAAGATVHVFKEFGSYQGEWYAKVTYNNFTGWIQGSYGSCSGCDALEAEFDYSDEPEDTFEAWQKSWKREGKKNTLKNYEAAKKSFNKRYAAFGKTYLSNILSQEEAEKEASKNIEWDSEAPEVLDFLKKNKI